MQLSVGLGSVAGQIVVSLFLELNISGFYWGRGSMLLAVMIFKMQNSSVIEQMEYLVSCLFRVRKNVT